MKKQYAVFGLGRFGGSLVKEFYELGAEVLAIDIDKEKVDDYAPFVTMAVQINGVDEEALKGVGIRNIDHAFVSFGENLETSILMCLVLKELGVSQVWAKAQNDYHARVLEKVGADRVIHPERDMAKRIAHHIVSDKIIDYIELSKDYSIVEIVASAKIHNKTLSYLDVRAQYGCNIVGIQRGQDIIVSPSGEEIILFGDVLIVMGHNNDINRFESQGL
jgi:trk system potassium uptake protein